MSLQPENCFENIILLLHKNHVPAFSAPGIALKVVEPAHFLAISQRVEEVLGSSAAAIDELFAPLALRIEEPSPDVGLAHVPPVQNGGQRTYGGDLVLAKDLRREHCITVLCKGGGGARVVSANIEVGRIEGMLKMFR